MSAADTALSLSDAPSPSPVGHQSHFIAIETPKVFATEIRKFTLQWQHLVTSVPVRNAETKAMDTKVILDDVSGYAKPGELLVIMGPSGAGKSSLLDCLAGRRPVQQGQITVNGEPWSKKMNRLASYVMQDDLFYPTLTVYEHLMFQAHLRMGKTHTVREYTQRVLTVMDELNLTKCRDTLIGGASLRGISGGERKRLSFATEVLTNPSLLFVDEPTSGLDSFMAETVVLQLQQLARDGRTVVATIHQPSSEIFALFDKLYLMANGGVVYHGRADKSVEYFAANGLECPAYLNPSDYYMRQLVVSDDDGKQRVDKLIGEWRDREVSMLGGQISHGESLELVPSHDNEHSYDAPRLGIVGQIYVLSKRNVVRLVRDQMQFQAAVFQTIFISIVVGLIFLQLDMTQKGVQNFAGAFFFFVVNQTFSAANPTFITVPLELPIIQREYKSGLYRLVAWYIAKNVSELPLQVFLPALFYIPAYFLVGVGHGASVFFFQFLVMCLVYSSAVALGYMVSCVTRRVELAPIIGVVIILPFMLFGGLLINSDDTPKYFVWVQYISPIKYGYEALMKIFWSEVTSIPCDIAVESCVARSGSEVLRNFSMTHRSAWGDVGILVVINLAFRAVGFAALAVNMRRKSR